MAGALRQLSLKRLYIFLLLLAISCTTAQRQVPSIVQGSQLGIQEAAVRAVEAISRVQHWGSVEHVTLSGLVEDVSIADTVKYDFKVGGTTAPSEGVEFSIREKPSFWEKFGNLEVTQGRVNTERDGALARWHSSVGDMAVLPETELSGPVELWFRESPNMRIALPHDVEAGPLNRVVIAEGATVTIAGASKISLARPLRLPLPPAGPSNISSLLRDAARRSERPLVSLVVTGAKALVSKTSEAGVSETEAARLKVKRLSVNALEVSSRTKSSQEVSLRLEGKRMWPLTNLLATDERVKAVEAAIRGLAGTGQSFDLLKAEASAFKLLRMQLNLERTLPQSPSPDSVHALRERPEDSEVLESEQQTWEVLVKLDGRSQPEPLSARRIGGVSEGTVTLSWSVATGNGTFVKPEAPWLNQVGLMDLNA